jgi:hypothetical protein
MGTREKSWVVLAPEVTAIPEAVDGRYPKRDAVALYVFAGRPME